MSTAKKRQNGYRRYRLSHIEVEDLGKVPLVGCSYGGELITFFLVQLPERFQAGHGSA